MRYIFALILLPLLSSCSVFDSEQNLKETLVIATADNSIFSILNKTENPILYMVIESETLTLIDLMDPCSDFKPNLEPRKNTQINYTDILGWEKGDKSAWFMWTDCQGSSFNETIKL